MLTGIAASLLLFGGGCAEVTDVQGDRDQTLDASTLADGGAGRCGNSELDPGEQCDDGNTEDGDTCRGDCQQDYTLCGNGQLDPGEQCDDGNTDNGDGCSAVCQQTQCDPVSCPTGCCDASGHCVQGTQDDACGTAATDCDPCADTGRICQDHACQGGSGCSGGDTLGCGNCGERACSAEGTWGTCDGQGACADGSVEVTGSCGQCGTLQRTCQSDCTWSGLSCDNEGPCAPGAVEQGVECGPCAHEERECGTDCTWGSWTCVTYSECTPGLVQYGTACGHCGTQQRTCQADCTWGAYNCVGEGVCSPGSQQNCNDCGTRSCASDCAWPSSCQGTRSCSGAATCDSEGVCQSPCGNGVCDVGEDKFNCAGDCPTFWCDTNTAVNNMCHFGPNAGGLTMTDPGGYCDPNGDGDFTDGDWNAGWTEYCTVRCPGNPGC